MPLPPTCWRLRHAKADWLFIMVTLRADFVDRFVSNDSADFRALLEQRQFWLGEMSEEDLREAVVFPNKRRGAFFELGLVEMIIRDSAAKLPPCRCWKKPSIEPH